MDENSTKLWVFRKKDGILFLGLILLGLIFSLTLIFNSKSGDRVNVRVDGRILESFSLDIDREYLIKGYDGGENMLVIKDGEAYISHADCPDGLCIKMGHISRRGQSIICLPHRISVEIDKIPFNF